MVRPSLLSKRRNGVGGRSHCLCVSLRVKLQQHILGSDRLIQLLLLHLAGCVCSPGCFRSWFTVWKYCVLPRAKCSRKTHCFCSETQGFLENVSHKTWKCSRSKYERSCRFLICCRCASMCIYPLEKTYCFLMLEGQPVEVYLNPFRGRWVVLTGPEPKWCLMWGDLCSFSSVLLCGTMSPPIITFPGTWQEGRLSHPY